MSTKHVAWRLAGELSRALVPAIVIAASSTSVSAQTFRGLVVDRSNNVLPGVLVTLVDSASNVIARTLSTDDGAYLLAARGTGTYRVRSLRIGFLPVMSEPMTLQTDESRVYRVVLDPAMVQLTSMHVSAKSSCGGRSDSNNGANAVHAAWEQATGAMTAASLNSSNAAYTATMLEVHRTLDASGRTNKNSGDPYILREGEPAVAIAQHASSASVRLRGRRRRFSVVLPARARRDGHRAIPPRTIVSDLFRRAIPANSEWFLNLPPIADQFRKCGELCG